MVPLNVMCAYGSKSPAYTGSGVLSELLCVSARVIFFVFVLALKVCVYMRETTWMVRVQ